MHGQGNPKQLSLGLRWEKSVSAGARAERRAPAAGGWLHGQVLQPNWGAPVGKRKRHWCKRVGKQLHVNPSLLLGPAVCLHTHKERAAQSQEREIF